MILDDLRYELLFTVQDFLKHPAAEKLPAVIEGTDLAGCDGPLKLAEEKFQFPILTGMQVCGFRSRPVSRLGFHPLG